MKITKAKFLAAVRRTRDLFKKHPDLYNGAGPHVFNSSGCGCIIAHVKYDLGVDFLTGLKNAVPCFAGWAEETFLKSANEADPRWAIARCDEFLTANAPKKRGT